ncbi:MAG: hypothetical protein KatS3mg105_2964 [Gemmatales bacterium]|nr:MAG: hypothetical protein KatS3mg105_2964 [Gemmatales bacterium]
MSTGSPQRHQRGDAGQDPFLIRFVDNHIESVGDETHVIQNPSGGSPVDIAMPVGNSVQNGLFMAPQKFAHRQHSLAQGSAQFAQIHQVGNIVIPMLRQSSISRPRQDFRPAERKIGDAP